MKSRRRLTMLISSITLLSALALGSPSSAVWRSLAGPSLGSGVAVASKKKKKAAALAIAGPQALDVAAMVPPPAPAVEMVSACYDGYTLRPSDEMCVKDVEELARPIDSVVVIPYLRQCPSPDFGLSPNGQECIKAFSVPFDYYCPAGWEDDGADCLKKEPGALSFTCPNGGVLSGNACVKVQRANHFISTRCPNGALLEEDGNCWKPGDTFDCTPPGPPPPPSKGEINTMPPEPIAVAIATAGRGGLHLPKKPAVKHVSLRALEGPHHHKKKPVIENPQEIILPTHHEIAGVIVLEEEVPEPVPIVEPAPVEEMVAVSAPRPVKVGVATQICQKRLQVDQVTVATCPDGYRDDGDDCVAEGAMEAVRLCENTGLPPLGPAGECPLTTFHSPKFRKCPPDSAEGSDEGCWRTISVPPQTVCPNNFIDTGDGCSADLGRHGELECPPGLLLSEDGRCLGQLVRPAVSVRVQLPPPCDSKGAAAPPTGSMVPIAAIVAQGAD